MLLRNPVYIVLIVLFVLLVLFAILACIYVRHWKKKKELELLGYPASTLSRSDQKVLLVPVTMRQSMT